MNEQAVVPHGTPAKIPVTLITGPLGAGKTTLLDRILKEPHGLKFAVVINEFGDIAIDQELIATSEADSVELINGCVCCAMASEFGQTLLRLAQRRDFDAIVVETSGVSDPMPLARTFLEDHAIALACELDAVVAVLDGRHCDLYHADGPALNQIALADVVIINKADVAAPRGIAELDAELRKRNPHAVVHKAVHCDVPIASLLGRHSFDLDRIEDGASHLAGHSQHHSPDAVVSSLSLASEGAVDPERFFAWIDSLIGAPGGGVLRSKGILAFPAEPRRFVFQSVDNAVDGVFQRNWRAGEEPNCRLVLIGSDLDRDSLTAGFQACTQQRVYADAI